MTYELFMNAIVSGADEAKARALLGGFTEMRERHQVIRVQHYEPEDTAVKGLPTIKQLQKERRPTAPQWQELHQILAKQPFILHVRTDTTGEVQKASNASAAGATSPSAGSASGIPAVRWTDLPDPPNPQLPFVTQRKVLDIADPDAQSILAANKFKATSNIVEESYNWWLNGIEYSLTRVFQLALDPDPAAAQQVPNLASLEPFAPFWILTVRAKVDSLPTATMPGRMKQGQAQLVQVRERLEGVFEFKEPDGAQDICQRYNLKPTSLRDDLPDDPRDLTPDSSEDEEEEGVKDEEEKDVEDEEVEGVDLGPKAQSLETGSCVAMSG